MKSPSTSLGKQSSAHFSRHAAKSLLEVAEQLAGRNVQRLGQLHDVPETGIPPPALDIRDLIPIQPGQLGEALLR